MHVGFDVYCTLVHGFRNPQRVEGATELLSFVRESLQLENMSIISSEDRSVLDRIMREFGWDEYLPATNRGAEDLTNSARICAVNTSPFLYIGDSSYDMLECEQALIEGVHGLEFWGVGEHSLEYEKMFEDADDSPVLCRMYGNLFDVRDALEERFRDLL